MINQNHSTLLPFGKQGDTGREGIILEDNPAGNCFLLRDLIPMNFFNEVVIVKLKMCVTGKRNGVSHEGKS